ncbi:WD-40 repeat protein, partial [Reticulomyxa filosa]
RTKEIEMIIANWIYSLSIKKGWIDDFDVIIIRYILRKYFKPLNILQASHGYANSVKFSHDNSKVVLGCGNGTVTILDITLKEDAQMLMGHTNAVHCAQFSRDGKMIVSCSSDKTIRLWSVKLRQEIRKLGGHTDAVTITQFSPNGKTIVSVSLDKIIRLWDVESGQEIMQMKGYRGNVNDIQFSFDGQRIVLASDNGEIEILDVLSGEIICELNGHLRDVLKAQFSSDDLHVISCSKDRTIRVWDAASGQQIRQSLVQLDNIFYILLFANIEQAIVLYTWEKKIGLLDLKTGIEMQRLKKNAQSLIAIDVSSDNNTIVSAYKDGAIQLWKSL